jgi:hypothetical protein
MPFSGDSHRGCGGLGLCVDNGGGTAQQIVRRKLAPLKPRVDVRSWCKGLNGLKSEDLNT